MKKKRITDEEIDNFSTKDADYESESTEKYVDDQESGDAKPADPKRKIKLATLSAVAVVTIVATVLFAVVALSGRRATEITDTLIYSYVETPEYGSGYMLEGFSEGLDPSEIIKLYLPSEVYGIPVIGISDRAFYGCESLVAVYIPDSVKYIGSSAFYGCTSLHEVYMPIDLEHVGADAFLGCDKLEVVNIGSDALDEWCGIKFANSDSSPFCNGASLNIDGAPAFELHIPREVRSIGAYAFYGLEDVDSIYIHEGVEYIGAWAMPRTEDITIYCEAASLPHDWVPAWNVFGCPVVWNYLGTHEPPEDDDGEEEVRDENGNGIPDDEEDIGSDDGGDDNPSIYTDSSGIRYELTYDGYYVVVGIDESYPCDGVTFLIPASIGGVEVRAVADYAFSEHTFLGGINFSAGIEYIGDYAFYGCAGMESFVVPDTTVYVGNYAFAYCTGLSDVIISDGVESIGECAFRGCESLESIILPESLSSIRAFAFDDTALSVVYYFGTREDFESVEVEMTDVDFSELLYIYSESEPREPGGFWHYVGNVAEPWAEYYSTGLEFTLSDSGEYYILTGIGSCTDSYLVIPATHNDLPVYTVGETAFYGNTDITAVYIPDGITGIGDGAFALCSVMTEVYIGKNVSQIGEVAFANSTALRSITVSEDNVYFDSLDGNLYTEDYRTLVQYAVGKADTSFSVPEGTYTIGGYAFYACNTLAQITLPNTLERIEKCAFHTCISLEYVGMTSTAVEYIGAWAFAECYSLDMVYLSGLTRSIGEGAFEDCTALDYIIVPESVTEMGRYVFQNTALTVYCVAQSQPEGWSPDWSFDVDVVVWDCYTGSEGLSYFISDDGTYYNVTGIGTCTDKDIVIPPLLPHGVPVRGISEYAFRNSDIMTLHITDGVKWIENNAFRDSYALISVTLGRGLESIGNGAFDRCDKLVEVINHSSLQLQRGNTTNGCVAYYAETVHNGSSVIERVGDFLFIVVDGEIYLLAYVGEDENIILPDSYYGSSYGVYRFAFYNNAAKSVILSSGVTSVGRYLVGGSLLVPEVIYIPASVTEIEWYAITYCEDTVVICEAESKPSGWDNEWCFNVREVIFGATIGSAGLEYTLSGDGTYYTVSGIMHRHRSCDSCGV